MSDWGTPEELERRLRIRVSVWAYAYEVLDISMVSDHVFDAACKQVNPQASTGHKKLDKFFRDVFVDYSGQWVQQHPEKRKLDALCRRLTAPS